MITLVDTYVRNDNSNIMLEKWWMKGGYLHG
jgi:hypothetical protein